MKDTLLAVTRLLVLGALFSLATIIVGPQQAQAQCAFATGDVNMDGIPLTVADLVLLIRILDCSEPHVGSIFEADLNGDCFIDYADAEVYACYFISGMSCFAPYGGYPVATCCTPSTTRGPCTEPSGDCTVRSQTNCLNLGGVYAGDSPDCDMDDDGLRDLWECGGYDDNGDGIIDVDLPAMGANPARKDIFVEVDWMGQSATPIMHNHTPDAVAMNLVVAAFNAAPVSNPDGSQGITLHIDRGQWGVLSGGNQILHQPNLSPVWTDFDLIKAANFGVEREKIFHYCVFGHNYSGGTSSGLSRGFSASDFIVSLGSWPNSVGTRWQQAGTFMHELGHNLDLHHGGATNVNRKPNYLSVMSYSMQMSGLRISRIWGNFDYSRWDFPDLDESSLDETVGLNGPPASNTYSTVFYCAGTSTLRTRSGINSGVDWNCDNDVLDPSVYGTINNDGLVSTLVGHEDWNNLVYDGGSIGLKKSNGDIDEASLPDNEEVDCMNLEEYQANCIRRGDADNSDEMNVADLTFMVAYLFLGGEGPVTGPNGDPDGSDFIDVADITYFVDWLFKGGPDPECF